MNRLTILLIPLLAVACAGPKKPIYTFPNSHSGDVQGTIDYLESEAESLSEKARQEANGLRSALNDREQALKATQDVLERTRRQKVEIQQRLSEEVQRAQGAASGLSDAKQAAEERVSSLSREKGRLERKIDAWKQKAEDAQQLVGEFRERYQAAQARYDDLMAAKQMTPWEAYGAYGIVGFIMAIVGYLTKATRKER